MTAEPLAYRLVEGCLTGEEGDGYHGPTPAEIVDELATDQRLGALCLTQLIAMAALGLTMAGELAERPPLEVLDDVWHGVTSCR